MKVVSVDFGKERSFTLPLFCYHLYIKTIQCTTLLVLLYSFLLGLRIGMPPSVQVFGSMQAEDWFENN
jgi:hypothetical protein